MAEHAQIVRVARYRPLPGGGEDLQGALHALASGLRGVPGLFGAQVCRVSGDPEWLALVSRWADEQAMQVTRHDGIDELTNHVAGLAQDQRVEHFIAEQ
ncbi:MAG TPA: antibiotic biosynthesis monooxygenase family protein [Chloroflexota bacterium]|nr:antibiotic biosynthesis monooxygenase family protein [Chloroflexota bacterium]